jgi:hypothetical protein
MEGCLQSNVITSGTPSPLCLDPNVSLEFLDNIIITQNFALIQALLGLDVVSYDAVIIRLSQPHTYVRVPIFIHRTGAERRRIIYHAYHALFPEFDNPSFLIRRCGKPDKNCAQIFLRRFGHA